MWENLQPFFLSAVIGLLIGIEREKSHPIGAQAFGVRTLILLALLGAVAAVVPLRAIAIVITVFVVGAVLAGYIRSTRSGRNKDIGLTTEFSAFFVYCAGLLSVELPHVVTVLAVLVLAILLSRTWLHRFSRQTLKTEELHALVTLLVLAAGIVPLMPNVALDPWGTFVPRNFGLIVVAIAGVQFLSYIFLRMLGSQVGLPLAGFFGGLVSSTAVFMAVPSQVREHPQLLRPALGALAMATAASFLEMAIIASITAPALLPVAGTVAGAVLVTALSITALTALWDRRQGNRNSLNSKQLPSPLNMKSVFKLAGLVALLLAITSTSQHILGNAGTGIVAFFAGLFELHATTFAIATLVGKGAVTAPDGLLTLALAGSAAFTSKFLLLWTQQRTHHKSRLPIQATLVMAALTASAILAFFSWN